MANACTNGIDTGFVALGYAKVAMLGVVQGITELMPISSTAHMRIVPALFGWQDPGSAFSAAMQLAALAAVISYFWRDVSDLLFGSLSAIGRRDFSDRSLKLAFGIAVGTIPIGVAGLTLAKLLNTCTSPIRGLEVVGIACIVMALLLGLAELIARHQRSIERVGLLDCLVVGIAQVGALIPGVSRSGSMRTAGWCSPSASSSAASRPLSRSGVLCVSSSASRLGPSPSTGHLSARCCSRAWRPDGSAEIRATVP